MEGLVFYFDLYTSFQFWTGFVLLNDNSTYTRGDLYASMYGNYFVTATKPATTRKYLRSFTTRPPAKMPGQQVIFCYLLLLIIYKSVQITYYKILYCKKC